MFPDFTFVLIFIGLSFLCFLAEDAFPKAITLPLWYYGLPLRNSPYKLLILVEANA
jgi:hypothetical protein